MRHWRGTLTRWILTGSLLASLALAGTWTAGAARASTPGEACLFNAPNGVSIGGIIGHVGWGFRNGTGDSWVYGATEGTGAPVVSAGPPATTHSWRSSGTWAQMLNTFGRGTQSYPTGAGYYLKYRCTTVTSSNPGSASAQVTAAESSGYNGLLDNCLTKSVKILSAYGVPGLPGAASVLPDTYFNSMLPSYPANNPGFNVVQWFTTLTVGVKLVDAVNGAYINTKPAHSQRPMHLQVFDASNKLVFDSGWSTMAAVTSGTDRYQATFQLPSPTSQGLSLWSTGPNAGIYEAKVQLDYTTQKYATGPIILITQGAGNSVADTPLTVGDVNQDNKVNTTDYNLMMQCYSDIAPPKGPCSSSLKRASDLNDDGYVNGTDYNIMLRVFQSQGGA